MSRPLRILYQGAYYHVLNRGQNRREVYWDKKDYQTFLNVLSQSCELYKVQVVAYCLMSNHYHLIVHTPQANLPQLMRQVNGVYTQIFNRRYQQDGPLFKGRYKALLVQEGSYLLRLVRYVHRNPVKAGIVIRAGAYPHSSHNAYLGQNENKWLRFLTILNQQLEGRGSLKSRYLEFMTKDDEELEDFLNKKKRKAWQAAVFGDEQFMDHIKMNHLRQLMSYEDVPQARKMRKELCIKRVKREILKEFEIPEEELFRSARGRTNLPRLLAVRLLRECGGLSYREIGEVLKISSYKTAATFMQRFEGRCQKNRKTNDVWMRLKERCSQEET